MNIKLIKPEELVPIGTHCIANPRNIILSHGPVEKLEETIMVRSRRVEDQFRFPVVLLLGLQYGILDKPSQHHLPPLLIHCQTGKPASRAVVEEPPAAVFYQSLGNAVIASPELPSIVPR